MTFIREGECHQCGRCCETVNLTVVRDITLRQHGNLEELKRYLSFRSIRIAGEDITQNLLFYEIDIPCNQLTEDRRCRLHGQEEKPLLCLKYPDAPDDIEECGFTFRKSRSF